MLLTPPQHKHQKMIFWSTEVLTKTNPWPKISLIKGKLHSKIISSDIKDFSVESNGEGPRSKFEWEDGQTDGQKWPKNLGWRRRAAGMSNWCQASAVRSCVPILINPEFDAALDRDSCVTHWMSSPGSALWCTDIWQSFFFFVVVVVVSWVSFDKTVTEYRVWHKVHGTAEEVPCYPQIPGW